MSADGKVLYVSDRNGKLSAINTATGADNWGGTGGLGRTIARGSHVAVGPNGNFYFSSGNSVHAFRDNGATVTELGSFQVNGITRHSPAVNAANEVFITEDMVGHKLGEFSHTRLFRGHTNKKEGIRI